MKKYIAALMCIVMLLGLTACQELAPYSCGTLLLSMNAAIRIDYNEDGQVLSIAGDNEAGRLIVEHFPEVNGTDCSKMVSDLITTIAAEGYDMGQPIIVLKQTEGSLPPSDTFLEDIQTSAKSAAPNHKVFLVSADALTAEGYLPPQTILSILIKQADLVNPILVEEPQIVDGQYHYIIDVDGTYREYYVDADTGLLKKVLPTPDENSSLGYTESPLPGIDADDPSDLKDEAPDPGPLQNDPDATTAPTMPTTPIIPTESTTPTESTAPTTPTESTASTAPTE